LIKAGLPAVSQDAVWLIDFATSVDLPLLTDLCKLLGQEKALLGQTFGAINQRKDQLS